MALLHGARSPPSELRVGFSWAKLSAGVLWWVIRYQINNLPLSQEGFVSIASPVYALDCLVPSSFDRAIVQSVAGIVVT